MEEELNDKVYGKYRILDAKTGEEKKGRYFVLKLDTKDYIEARIAKAALLNYALMQSIVGRRDYCDEIADYVRKSV